MCTFRCFLSLTAICNSNAISDVAAFLKIIFVLHWENDTIPFYFDYHLQVGPSAYMFAVNNNGMIIFHPRLKTVVCIPFQGRSLLNLQLGHIFFTLTILQLLYPSFTIHTEMPVSGIESVTTKSMNKTCCWACKRCDECSWNAVTLVYMPAMLCSSLDLSVCKKTKKLQRMHMLYCFAVWLPTRSPWCWSTRCRDVWRWHWSYKGTASGKLLASLVVSAVPSPLRVLWKSLFNFQIKQTYSPVIVPFVFCVNSSPR